MRNNKSIKTSTIPDSVGIIVRVGNGGANVAAAPINVAIYNGDPDAGGVLLGTVQTTQNLNPGGFEDVTLTVTPTLLGPLTICAVVDDDGTGAESVNECNESNNQCCTEFASFCGCIDDLAARPKSGKIQLTWTDIGAAGYNVYRSIISGGPYMFIANTTSTYATYLDMDVSNGTTYFYVVRPVASIGSELCQSNETSATPQARTR